MARTVELPQLRELLDQGAQLVEVLPREEYEELHLPGAISLPIKELDVRTAARLDRARPVVVYCWDALCDMSPRAATLLGELGFDAYDYALSKVDWMARGLPMEGSAASRPIALRHLHGDVATCTLGDGAETIGQAIAASAYGFALVLAGRVVLGRVRRSDLEHAATDATAATIMRPGPSTWRPDVDPGELDRQLAKSDASTAILTTPSGELLGVVRRTDLSS